MSDTLHERAFDLFVAACQLQGEQRRRYLDEASTNDSALRDEVESLLAHDTGEAVLGGDSPRPEAGEYSR